MISGDSEYVYLKNHPQHLEFARLCVRHESAAYPARLGRSRSQWVRNLASLLFSLGKPRRKLFLLEGPGAVTAVLLRRARGCRILMIHADPTLWALRDARGLQRRLTLFLLARVDGFLSPARLMEDLARGYFPGKRHALFPMYVDTARWRPLPPEKRTGDFLYIGRADWYKNQELLLRAFRAVKSRHGLAIRFTLIGNVLPAYAPVLRPLLDETVTITGWIAQPWENPPAAGYYFNLARLEPSGTNILEALALGLAPIVSDGCGYAADVVAGIDARLVVPLEEERVVAAWEWLHALPEPERAALREKCLETARAWNREHAHAGFRAAFAACAEPGA